MKHAFAFFFAVTIESAPRMLQGAGPTLTSPLSPMRPVDQVLHRSCGFVYAISKLQVLLSNLRHLWNQPLGRLKPPESRFETIGKSLLGAATQLIGLVQVTCLSKLLNGSLGRNDGCQLPEIAGLRNDRLGPTFNDEEPVE